MIRSMELKKSKFGNKVAAVFMLITSSILSFIASYTGFAAFTAADQQVPINAVCLVAILQCVMLISAREYFRNRKWLYALSYLVCMSFSLLFGIPYFISQTGLEQQIMAEQIEHSQRQLQQQVHYNRQVFMAMAASFDELASYSQQRAKTEEKQAGTCQDGDTITGDGPRLRLRKNDALMMSAFAADMSELATTLTSKPEVDIETGVNAQAEAVFQQAASVSAIVRSPQITSAKVWLTSRLESGNSQHFDQLSGRYFRCVDQGFNSLAQAILQTRFQSMSMPSLHSVRDGSATKLAFESVGALVTGQFELLTAYHFLAMLLALLVDGCILFAIFIISQHDSTVNSELETTVELARSRYRGLINKVIHSFDEELDLLQRQARRHQRHVSIWVEEHSRVEELLMRLEKFGLAKQRRHSWWRRLARQNRQQRCYHLEPKVLKELLIQLGFNQLTMDEQAGLDCEA